MICTRVELESKCADRKTGNKKDGRDGRVDAAWMDDG